MSTLFPKVLHHAKLLPHFTKMAHLTLTKPRDLLKPQGEKIPTTQSNPPFWQLQPFLSSLNFDYRNHWRVMVPIFHLIFVQRFLKDVLHGSPY